MFLDQDAVPTLVEVKRSENTQIRREVVGQMLDYAANAVVHWADGTMAQHFAETHSSSPGGAMAVLQEFLQLGDTTVEDAEARVLAWWEQADTNLRAGRLRLLFVADEIPSELRRIIEFLNEQMADTEVLGVEVRNFEGGDLRALVPRIVGLTEAARDRKSQGGMVDTRSLEEVWAAAGPEVIECRRLLDGWAAQFGIERTDLTKSRRYRWPNGSTVVLLYPASHYRLVQMSLGAVPDPTIAASLQLRLSELRSGAHVAAKEPSVACGFVVAHWADLEQTVLAPLAQATRPNNTSTED